MSIYKRFGLHGYGLLFLTIREQPPLTLLAFSTPPSQGACCSLSREVVEFHLSLPWLVSFGKTADSRVTSQHHIDNVFRYLFESIVSVSASTSS
jgi:hypothetical protein